MSTERVEFYYLLDFGSESGESFQSNFNSESSREGSRGRREL